MAWNIHMIEAPEDHFPPDVQIGDCFRQIHRTDDGNVLVDDYYVILPNGHPWRVHGPSSDGTPWDVSGELPNITVRPSIFPQPIKRKDGTVYRKGWHGWINNGVLSDDLEGRTYP